MNPTEELEWLRFENGMLKDANVRLIEECEKWRARFRSFRNHPAAQPNMFGELRDGKSDNDDRS